MKAEKPPAAFGPDPFGTWWLTSPKTADGDCWAIFRSKRLIMGSVAPADCWFLLAGVHGIVFDGPTPRWYFSVQEAWRAALALGFKPPK